MEESVINISDALKGKLQDMLCQKKEREREKSARKLAEKYSCVQIQMSLRSAYVEIITILTVSAHSSVPQSTPQHHL